MTTAVMPSVTSTSQRTRPICPPPRANSGDRPGPTGTSNASSTATTPPTCPRKMPPCQPSGVSRSSSTTASTTPVRRHRTRRARWPCRPDPFSTYRAGFEIRTYRACQRILMFHQFPAELGAPAVLVRSTDLTYLPASQVPDPQIPVYSSARLGHPDRLGQLRQRAGYQTAQLPPLEFQYSPLALDGTLRAADPASLANLSGEFDGTRRRWVDLDGEGLQGVLTEDDGAWYYQRNVSALDPGGGPTHRPLRTARAGGHQADPNVPRAAAADRPQRRRAPVRGRVRAAGRRLVRARRPVLAGRRSS